MAQRTNSGREFFGSRCISALFSAALFTCLLLGTAGSVGADPLLYVGDYSSGNGYVNYFDALTGGFQLQTEAPGMDYPGQMAIGPGGDLYVADQQGTIDVFNPNSGSVLNQFGSSNLTTPSGLAFSPSGDLYVSDFNGGNGVVDEFDGSGNFIAQVIGPSAGLDYPNAMTFGPDGNLYIADSGSGSIYEYNITSTAFSVFASDTSANVNLVFGPGGNLYVVLASGGVDEFNGTTGALIGPFGDTFTATGADIEGMAFGADGNLYLADSNGVDVVDGSTGDVTGNFIAVDGVDVINPTFLTFGPSVPEPATFLPGALGLMLLGWLRLRGRNLQRKGEGR